MTVDNTLPGDLPPDPPDAFYAPGVRALPTADELADYLSMKQTLLPEVLEALGQCANDAADYTLSRLSGPLMVADGAVPPDTVPGPVARAVLMYGAALWRRRNSVNGYDGYDDLGTVRVTGFDPDVERQLDRWRAWTFA